MTPDDETASGEAERESYKQNAAEVLPVEGCEDDSSGPCEGAGQQTGARPPRKQPCGQPAGCEGEKATSRQHDDRVHLVHADAKSLSEALEKKYAPHAADVEIPQIREQPEHSPDVSGELTSDKDGWILRTCTLWFRRR